jgi:carboxyl-terminal processing protease
MGWKRWLALYSLTAALAAAPVSTAMAAPSEQNVKTLVEVFTQIVDTHYSHPDENKILEGAIRGMLEALNDPHTNYLSPEEYKEFVEGMNYAYAGIGVLIRYGEDGTMTVGQVYSGSPAAQAGLQVGDRIVQVDDLIVTPDNRDLAVKKLRGQAGTQVVIRIIRGGETLTRTLTRQEIKLPTVLSHKMDNGLGYLAVYSFGEETAVEVKKELLKLEAAGVTGLILDLRGNSGGYVVSALTIADLFLSEGPILYVHGEDGERIRYDADPDASKLPLVVLVDRESASASEILAGALQKSGRAKLVGEQTYGKGTMQYPQELPNGGFLKVSVDRWEFRDGTSNDKVGLTPDVRLTRPEAVMNAAEQLLLPGRLQMLLYDRVSGKVRVNGYELTGAPALVTEGERVYLPLRYTVESLGSEVKWLPESGEVVFRLSGHDVRIRLSAQTITVDGLTLQAADAIRSVGGSTYILTDALGRITGRPVQVTEAQVIVESN